MSSPQAVIEFFLNTCGSGMYQDTFRFTSEDRFEPRLTAV